MKILGENSFFAKVRFYRHFKKELDIFLSRHPEKWTEFNDIFIAVFNSVSEDILKSAGKIILLFNEFNLNASCALIGLLDKLRYCRNGFNIMESGMVVSKLSFKSTSSR